MPLTLMALTTMAEPGTMLTSNFFLEAGWVSGDAGAMYLEEHGRGGRGGSGYKISLEGYKDINGKIGRGTRDRSLEVHV